MGDVKSLATKMAAIMDEVPTMVKSGKNTQQNYDFVTAEDIKADIRPLLTRHHVGMFASMVDVQRTTATNARGTVITTTIAKMVFTLVDGESGESIECVWFGEANDTGDKGVNKAATAATKYFLINTFLLSTTDTEADEEYVPTPAQIPAASQGTTRNVTAPLPLWFEIEETGQQLHKEKWGAEKYKLVTQHAPGVKKPSEMTQAQLQEIWNALQPAAQPA